MKDTVSFPSTRYGCHGLLLVLPAAMQAGRKVLQLAFTRSMERRRPRCIYPVPQAPYVNLRKTELGQVPGDSLRHPLQLQNRAAGLLYTLWKPQPPSLQAAREVMGAVKAAMEPKVDRSATYALQLQRLLEIPAARCCSVPVGHQARAGKSTTSVLPLPDGPAWHQHDRKPHDHDACACVPLRRLRRRS